MDAPSLRIEVNDHGQVTMVKPIGYLTSAGHAVLEEQLDVLFAHGHHLLVVDLGAAEYLSSTVLGVFLFYKKKLEDCGGCLILAACDESLLRAIQASGLRNALDIRPTREEALKLAKEKVGSGKWEALTV